jgi:hypothetical protein
MRTSHAREILDVKAFPGLDFQLLRLTGARPDPTGVAFSAEGRVTMMGQPVPITLSGTLRAPDQAARARLGLTEPAVLLVAATFPLDLRATPLATRAKDFDSPTLTLSVNLVLAKESP